MLGKLAFRNMKRSLRDYSIYLFTMILISALMFSFNSMIFSENVRRLSAEAGLFGAMIGVATFFVVLIVIWLIHYMVKFMAGKRSREFGIYMLLGFHKRQIARLFLRENLLLGVIAFAAGILPGLFLQQVMLTAIYGMLDISYDLSMDWGWETFALTGGIYFGSYVLALLRNHRRFRRMDIRDMLDEERRGEEAGQGGDRSWWIFAGSLVYFLIFAFLLLDGRITMETVWPLLAGLSAAVYGLFAGLSGFLVKYIRAGGAGLWRHERIFVLRQLASKVRTMRFTMGTLTILFAAAFVGASCALMLNQFQLTQAEEKWPFDVMVYSPDPGYDFRQEEQLTEEYASVESSRVYQIYENGASRWNDWLESQETGADGAYFHYDTYMKLSDYNALRAMLGREPVSLGDGEYLVQTKERLRENVEPMTEKPLSLSGPGGERQDYTCAGIETGGFEQNGHNGADYVLVVPDAAADRMQPYYALFAAQAQGRQEGDKENLRSMRELRAALMELEGAAAGTDDWYGWEETTEDYGYGSDIMYVSNSFVLVREPETFDMQFLLSTFMFPLFYIGLVYLCVALTVLAVQQLSDAAKHRRRYDILRKLGLGDRELSGLILRQLFIYYLCPFLAALALGAMFAGYIGENFARYSGVTAPAWSYFGLSVLLFTAVYLIYFAMTYIEFRRNVMVGR